MRTEEPIPEAQGFRFQHGAVARSLEEFRAVVAQAPAEAVWYHREHFAPWLREVVRDLPLARRLESYAAAPPAPDVYREVVLDLVARRLEERARLSPGGSTQR